MSKPELLQQLSPSLWELPREYKPGMLVPARIVATEKLINSMDEAVFEQISNVATLPGVVKHVYCMPDGHSGYGFPVGGVAAMDLEKGVISPGGIGFDINCGMRLLVTELTLSDVKPHLEKLVDALYRAVPSGVGGRGLEGLSRAEFERVMVEGAHWCVERGYGWQEDLERTEQWGRIEGADPGSVSLRATERGIRQLGTLGSGNHYLEVQVVYPEEVMNTELAEEMGITRPYQVAIMFHCGSRGFGHQVAADYMQSFSRIMGSKYGIKIPDRDLACAPFSSPEGSSYYSAMNCAANMAFANRQIIAHRVREVFSDIFGKKTAAAMHQVYDVSHNIAKIEEHEFDGERKRVLVHRKGSTRAFGPGMEGLSSKYLKTGQPVIIGGSMETGSYLLTGMGSGSETFFSTTHGSGRVMSRRLARKTFSGRDVHQRMLDRGIYIRTGSFSGFSEEAGGAYKDIEEVISAATQVGISRPVARFSPIGNVKG
ncbi:tRNA-splicing ligase [Chitinispirillum alkaliphilum]|nr:tRNA-splicing ligase [Chitinispirillum alkaliphilum]